ncbi:MAG TPA: AzlC family ABC transporter permease [Acidimicrobiales bacterium]
MSVSLAIFPFGVAFGVAASEAGLTLWQASGFSVLVFAGSAQLAAVDVVGDGGLAVSAIAAGLLLNLRALAFGLAMAPALRGPWWKRALWSQFVIDETTAVATAQADPRWRRYGFLLTGVLLFVSWNVGTVVGAAALSSSGDLVTDLGIDAVIPAAFLALLWPRLVRSDQRRIAAVGALVALALAPVAPPGVPILAAAGAVVVAGRNGAGPGPAATPPPGDAGAPTESPPEAT